MKLTRLLLWPFSLLYGLIIRIRNFLFDRGILHSVKFDLPVICVGNLSVGGTGKTPMVEYLINLLNKDHNIAVLSRGYKRKTRGFVMAAADMTARDIGDEPMQLSRKFPGLTVAVSKDRVLGISGIVHQKPDTAVIILDDAFQYRPVRAGWNVLLTTFDRPYFDDVLLPAGTLRDSKRSSLRADVVVVTKCDPGMREDETTYFIRKICGKKTLPVFFATFEYKHLYHLFTKASREIDRHSSVLLVSGIAKPHDLVSVLKARVNHVQTLLFRDHHDFSGKDIDRIKMRFNTIIGDDKLLITTEKDAVKLLRYKDDLSALPIFVIPATHRFLFDGEKAFNRLMLSFAE